MNSKKDYYIECIDKLSSNLGLNINEFKLYLKKKDSLIVKIIYQYILQIKIYYIQMIKYMLKI